MTAGYPSGQNRRLPVVRERVHIWKRRAATVAVGVLSVCMAYGVVFGHNGLTAFANKRKEAKDLTREMQQLQAENERLRGPVERLQNDPSAIEHQAREDLHYTRAGEVIYTIPTAPAAQAAATTTTNP